MIVTFALSCSWFLAGLSVARAYFGDARVVQETLAEIPARVLESAATRLADEDRRAGFGPSPEWHAVHLVAFCRGRWCASQSERKAARKATLARIFTRKVKVTP